MLGNPPMPAEAEIYRPKASHVGESATRYRIMAFRDQFMLLPRS